MSSPVARQEVGPRYSQLVVYDGTAYIAGQIADDFDADVRVQAGQVFDKLDRLLAQAGATKSALLSLTVWIADFADYGAFNETYDGWVDPEGKPARATVRAELLDPRLRVEIAAVAAVPSVAGSAQRDVAEAADEIEYLEVSEVLEGLGDGSLLVVDVRDAHERAGGIIPDSVHAARGMLEFHLDPLDGDHLPELATDRTLVMVCGSGGRGALATRLARRHGLDAVCLRGGMRAWRDADGPLAAPPEP